MVVVVDVAMATNKSISYIGICSSDIKTGSVATNTELSVDTVATNKANIYVLIKHLYLVSLWISVQ